MSADDVLERFSPATREWFRSAFPAPTPAQRGAWESVAAGQHTLVVAPTGSGKTLSAFLWALDRLATAAPPAERRRRCRVLYVSPLKALAVDVERNLRSPLAGIRATAGRRGLPVPDIGVGLRSGDTPAKERRSFLTKPPDVLITTPESLFLLLTSNARESLRGVETVIVDEVHAVAGNKRGAHLSLSLERLDALLERPAQRIGLSATVRPVDEVARFLGGPRPVTVVQPPADKRLELRVVVPLADMTELGDRPAAGNGSAGTSGGAVGVGYPDPDDDAAADGAQRTRPSIWPHVEEAIVDLVQQHRSTIVFANSRRLAERLTARLNEIVAERSGDLPDPEPAPPAQVMAQSGASLGATPVIARAHHGSVSREQRRQIEDDLKLGRLACVVATSSLELGIDMGTVDLVVQVEAPPSVASGMQRVGRAGHQVGKVSRGVLFPKHRGDLVLTAVTAERMRAGRIEEFRAPQNPLDVLAQQIVAMGAVEELEVESLFDLVRRAAPFTALPRSAFEATLDLLAGRYPSDEFTELRPRVVWDRVRGTVQARPGAARLAVTSGGTIPDRGMYGVFLAGAESAGGGARTGARVGELDEEMVYESRVGDVFALGTTSWRIEDITHDRVLVTPAPGVPGRMPFWKGDTLGRPAELGRAVGAFVREVGRLDATAARERVRESGLDVWAADNLVAYLDEQRAVTRQLPTDRTLVVERFRDELGDWRVVLHSPYGARVHGAWALAVGARLRERYGVEAQAVAGDDGIVLRVPDTDAAPPGAEACVFDADEIADLVTAEVGTSALFAARFRECAARALLLPRRDPGRRSPLWQQRQRAAALLQVVSRYPSFPIALETVRECLQDVYDVPALTTLMRDVAAHRVRVVEVETTQPSPFARSLLFGYLAEFIYAGDLPLAERRAAALSLDQTLLAELLGTAELRELLAPDVVAGTEAELQRLAADRQAGGLEQLADLLRLLGPLSEPELADRTRPAVRDQVAGWLADLSTSGRVAGVRVAGEERWTAIEDLARLRDALGTAVPPGVPDAFTEPVPDPLGDLVSRYARTHGPFTSAAVAARFGLGAAVVAQTLQRLAGEGRVVHGEFTPGGTGAEWCDAEVLRRLRRRSLAALRKEIEPVEPAALGRFLPRWQGVGSAARNPTGQHRGVDGVLAVVEQLAGCPVPASALEPLVLASRVADYSPAMLDELTTGGEVLWAGQGSISTTDGWVSLHLPDNAPLTLPPLDTPEAGGGAGGELTVEHLALLDLLAGGGAYFFRQLVDAVTAAVGDQRPTALDRPGVDDQSVAAALWDLVWWGRITNDTLAPLRSLLSGGRPTHRSRRPPPRARVHGRRPGGSRPRMPSRTGPPSVAGRWSLLPERDEEPTRRAHAAAETLLERHGVVTRGAVMAERVPGGFAAIYKVLRALEEAGRCRRGYFVEHLGAAQFGTPGAVDRLRAEPAHDLGEAGDQPAPDWRSAGAADGAGDTADRPVHTVTLAACDPANPYGAALPWPPRVTESGHRPGRKAGALVVLVEGDLVLYVERGGRTLLTFSEQPHRLQPAVDALAAAVRQGALGRITVERADGTHIHRSPLGHALEQAGFHVTPRGLRLRG